MSLLPILKYPDLRLTKKAAVVTEFNDELKQLAADMAETMYKAPGVGLAATQIDRHIRLIVIDVSEEKNELLVLDKVERASQVKIRAQNLEGKSFEIDCDGLLAVCVQHEMDHLEGKVFVDHLSQLKKTRILHKIKKQRLEKAKEEKAATNPS